MARQRLTTPADSRTLEPAAGFTLVEMLAVLAIVIILIALIGPAVGTIVRGPLLTQTSDEIIGLFNLGQQTATARNQSVAVRFYQYADAAVAGESAGNADSGKYRAAQLFLINDDGVATPLRAVLNFPVGIIADSGTALSTLLDKSLKKPWTTADPQVSLPRCGRTYNCCEFRFRPDGSTNLPIISPSTTSTTNNWFITLHNQIDGDARTAPPPNYATVQIDPTSGSSSAYRP